jgi:ATP-binding cassette, subfamily B, bacterial PglK
MIKKYLQLWFCLAPLHRIGAMALTLGNVLASLLEVLGLALFGAVLLRVTQGEASTARAGMAAIMSGSELRVLAGACGIVYLGKNVLMLALAWLEAKLTFGVQAHLSAETLSAMMRQDYEEACRADQSARINLLTIGMQALAFNVLLPGLTLLAEATLMLALVLFLVLTQPAFVGGMLVTLCAVAGGMVLVSRRMVLRLDVTRHRLEDEKLQLLTGIFGHLREMYVYAAGARAVAHLQALLARLSGTYGGFQMLQTAPRFLLEVALVGVLLAIVFWQAPTGIDPTLVVSIGVFGVAGFRLLLGMNRVVNGVQAMRFAGEAINRITNALAAAPRTVLASPGGRRAHAVGAAGALQLAGVSYAFDPDKPLLRGVNFEVPQGTLIAIKGRSGAGKSTLLEIMAGLRTPSAGWVELDGQRIARKQELVGRVAYAGQQPAVFPDTIRANVAFGLAPEEINDRAVWRALAHARLDEVVHGLPGQLDHRLGLAQTLSGGQVQRLALARALYMDCDYLLLDEPTAALDAETELQLLDTLEDLAETKGVVVVSHRPAPLDAADAVWTLIEGRLVVSDVQAVLEP